MAIQREAYPGQGYHPQQTYITHEEIWYTTDGHTNNHGWGIETRPNPYVTMTPQHSNHHINFGPTHSPEHEGWPGLNKPHQGHNYEQSGSGYGTTSEYYNHGSSGQKPPYNCNDTSQYSHDNKFKNEKVNTEYKNYHEYSHVPMATTVVEPGRCGGYSGDLNNHNNYGYGPQNGNK